MRNDLESSSWLGPARARSWAKRRPASVLAALLLACAGGAAACTTESGTTPSCTEDLTDDTGKPIVNARLKDGCNPFAVCRDADGKTQDPKICCKPFDKDAYQLQLCLYGFGAADPPAPPDAGGGAGGAGGSGGKSGSGGTGG